MTEIVKINKIIDLRIILNILLVNIFLKLSLNIFDIKKNDIKVLNIANFVDNNIETISNNIETKIL